MKKLIGLILALCMLGTMASAATVTQVGEAAVNDADMTVTISFSGLDSAAQATMLAYDVTNVEGATKDTAYVNEATTPIVGIDQATVADITTAGETPMTSFTFKVAEDYEGKIVVKVGGTDVSAPISALVEFAQTEEGVQITLNYGDVNGDGSVNSSDASLILQKAAEIIAGFTDGESRAVPDTVADVNADGTINSSDASLVLQKAAEIINGFTDGEGNALTTYTYTYVAPEA